MAVADDPETSSSSSSSSTAGCDEHAGFAPAAAAAAGEDENQPQRSLMQLLGTISPSCLQIAGSCTTRDNSVAQQQQQQQQSEGQTDTQEPIAVVEALVAAPQELQK
jgi:hypothetical protein